MFLRLDFYTDFYTAGWDPLRRTGQGRHATGEAPGTSDGMHDERASWEFVAQLQSRGEADEAEANESEELLRQLVSFLRNHPSFPKEAFADPGVHTGNVSKLIVSDSFPPDDPAFQPVREGRNLAAFYCGPPKKRLWVEPTLDEGQYCTIRPRDVYESTPILLRQTADRPIACRHTDRTFFRNSVLACRGVPGIEDEVVVAILNSELIRRWYQVDVQESGQRAFPQVKVRNLRRLPMVASPASGSVLSEVVDLVRRIEDKRPAPIDGSLRRQVETAVCELYEVPAEVSEWLVASVGDAVSEE